MAKTLKYPYKIKKGERDYGVQPGDVKLPNTT